MSIHEECGVFGVLAPEKSNVASMTYYGLYALQHRGQESCGIVVNDNGAMHSYKDLGIVGDVFDEATLAKFPKGTMAVGHVRYGTTDTTGRKNCQPIEVNHQKGKMAIAHNGNLSNSAEIKNKLELDGAIFHTSGDAEIIAYTIIRQRLQSETIEEAISKAMNVIEGAYSLCIMSKQKLIACRDPYGFRPLCYGKCSDGTYIIASETCALDAVGAEFVRDLLPGEILVFSKEGVTSIKDHCDTKPKKLCIFEYIYFARPDSVVDGVSVHKARRMAGKILAECYHVDADVVIGVPDSGLDAALGYAEGSGIPYGIGLIKNKYIGRTFIAPSQDVRVDKVKIKLSAVAETVKGKRVVLVDDSIVRGTTSWRLTEILREAGAKEIHMMVSAPPFLHPCYYGTDIDSEEHLIASKYNTKEIAKMIGVDSLGYLPKDRLRELIDSEGFCSACFDGDYPTRIVKGEEEEN